MSSISSYHSQRYSSSFRQGKSRLSEPDHEPFINEKDRNLLRHGALPARESFANAALTAQTPGRPIRLGDSFQMSTDVSQFEPQEVVVVFYNHHIVIQAEQVAEDGTIRNTFSHKYQLPEDIDPMSVSCTLTEAGMLVISVRRNPFLSHNEPPPPLYRSEMTL
ncbi:heat shock protein beta-7-like [Erpetoichthys calabaricus]|uniref:heat shock protein beta-7-like n=1 Tax=Erpetoichthys calabaricus TaxID=27687 RepID=UPI00109FF954|nr:heat shock protein beta-7-like [Erpetoichthys calabaricus]